MFDAVVSTESEEVGAPEVAGGEHCKEGEEECEDVG